MGVVEQKLRELALPIEVTLWDGSTFSPYDNPEVSLKINSPSAATVFSRPTLGKIAKAYVQGMLDIDGEPKKIIEFGEKLVSRTSSTYQKRSKLFDWWRHTKPADRRSIQHHYDVGNEFYGLWLDESRVYSCAYFKGENDSLDLAQQQKLDHICRKLMLKDGDRFLDIGCGWGALIVWAAQNYGVRSTGITLSEEQFAFATEKISRLGLENNCKVELLDYRDLPLESKYDKIASVGMFEHVGKANLSVYFQKIYSLLNDGGMLMNHGITTNSLQDQPLGSDIGTFVDKYVFPGGELVHVSTVLEEMSKQGFELWDAECLRQHYARTLWQWVDRLEKNQEKARALIGEERYRVWRIYMAGSAHAFERGWISIFQMLGVRAQKSGTVNHPLTRQHIYDE